MVDEQWGAQEFRDTAATLRLLARQMRADAQRRELLDLAERFERMAERIERGGSAPKSED
jgi:hypothetical protein